ncbi:uncharacterized protein A4U43_C07F27260 [Asparagus officinalis]|uniref:Uncharacterized protein n=1 Tax=Asparagus officinalis TaxID=4686 RepID=A0A5P1EKH8_ASPOF|nr:uncharacterized protein A4U43_C07F27260 [Asparagus officinalis]
MSYLSMMEARLPLGFRFHPRSVLSTRRNVRGATRGKGTERLVRQLVHAISVPIPSSSGAPEGEHATSLANEIGKEIRSSAYRFAIVVGTILMLGFERRSL